jgi:tripeptide aminopeptidase
MNRQRLLERFLRYVQIDTTAREGATDYPSSPGQLALGRLLVAELKALGLEARQDPHGIVLATVPATIADPAARHAAPVIALCAHLDTSPEASGSGVRPQVIEHYAGGDLTLPGGDCPDFCGRTPQKWDCPPATPASAPRRVIRVAENPELEQLRGQTIITSDGTTLLGADDKAGVAVIMEAAAWLSEHPQIAHGPLRICFTCDEEIGRGVDKLDLAEIGAAACYTLDGQAADTIDVETFSADLAVVTVRGVNIHPSIAKGRMTNAIRVAADFLARLPRDRLSPETTEGREGFLHPYEVGGGVAEVKLRILLRDFQAEKLAELAALLEQAAAESMRQFPQAQIEVARKPQYRNMAEGLAREPRAVTYAERALWRLARTARRTIVRGGTDGSRLTELGLPTPNLACGQHNPHSPLEWACLEEMLGAVEWLVALAEVWAAGESGD